MMSHLRAIVGNLRGLISYAVVQSVDDTHGAQTVNVKTAGAGLRADIEVMQPFGFSSVPPADGATTAVLAIGGDPGNLLAFPLSNPSTRFGGLTAGEAVLYAADGTRVHVKPGGFVEVWGKEVTVNATTVTINALGDVTVNANVVVNGNLTASGDVSDAHGTLDRLRGHYNEHEHTNNGASPPTAIDPE